MRSARYSPARAGLGTFGVFLGMAALSCTPTQPQAPVVAPCPSSTPTQAAALPTATQPAAAPGADSFLRAPRPKLVLVIAIDQFRADTLTKLDAYFSPNGFKRLLREGATMTGHYGHYVTYTGPGHALMLSGSYPYVNGIAANKFFNTESGRSEAMVFDAGSQILGQKTDADMDVSPRNFIGSTVGDELIMATGGQAKTIALATKGRGAILMGGRLAKTYFMNDDNGEMTSSTYYMKTLPPWAAQWNSKKVADSYFGKTWDRMAPIQAYATAMPDDASNEGGGKGLGKTFPHTINGKLKAPGADFYEALCMSPFGNDYEFSFAQAALEGENLGGRGVTDLLAISLSATDLAGHDFGPFSQEVQDLMLRTDKQISDFLDYVYGKLGKDNVLVMITGDHGATPVPEQMASLGFEAARIKKKVIKETVDAALKKKFGGDKWVVALEDPHIFLDRKHIADKKLDAAEVQRVAGEAAASIKGFGGYFTRTQLINGEIPNTELGKSIMRSYHQARGGDVVMWTLPFYFWGKYGEKDVGSTHGTWYRYDSEVPVLISGSAIKPGRYPTHEMVDIAPTLSHILGISAPAGSEGKLIPILK
ncbi:MAG: alkaline phosphatase family protein [Deltaproteobacteria bacterium]|nr:alkaline phosphatase family protein [Deltaproteobacteria bacterium]